MSDPSAITVLHAAAFTCDGDGWIVAVNARCAALFGAREELLVGGSIATLFPNERDVDARLRRASGESIRLQGRRLSGGAFDVEAQASIAADGSLTCRLWDVLGAASPWLSTAAAARTR